MFKWQELCMGLDWDKLGAAQFILLIWRQSRNVATEMFIHPG